MRLTLAHIDSAYGGITAYFDRIGFTQQWRQRLLEALTTTADKQETTNGAMVPQLVGVPLTPGANSLHSFSFDSDSLALLEHEERRAGSNLSASAATTTSGANGGGGGSTFARSLTA